MPHDQGPHVAIVGAGFSGLLTAIQLLRHCPAIRVSLIERRAAFGPGVAYDTGNPGHLLNVRLDNMSAFPDQPGHLADWLAEQPTWRAQDGFITRGMYGDYLRHLLDEARDGAAERLTLVRGEARSIEAEAAGWRIVVGDQVVTADAVILALGNLEPASPSGIDAAVLASSAYVDNPWRIDVERIGAARSILVIGSGLTMVDAVLTLRRTGRRFTALSRHGLLPRGHATVPPQPFSGEFSGGPAEVLGQVRDATRTHDWRAVFDRLRQNARILWRGWTPEQKRRFLRHLRPVWDVHRHRMSPGTAREIASLLASGELTVLAGKLTGAVLDGGTVEASWRPRHRRRPIRDRFDLVINCTGPLGVIQHSAEPVIRDLLAKGYGRPDPLGLGLEVDEAGRLTNAAGEPAAGLYAIGPMTRGAFWEMTAVPDLRGQARDLAATLTAGLAQSAPL
ncbi:FAD/NAD(P)-binding protein [Brevundimonas sp. SL130]|uniref:FAD/NAD(P)-binding protein n=1 Tax=Brevundimonas sp. SL130 TaxID=2995143 RepID=UPI00226D1AD2|nr:FAD/NAD(P)-binding protein [Brevundimonas sp. SL130]WAC60603.1 FAD/NAD(P)-binding protein [Brevundimonas sp. SL130]